VTRFYGTEVAIAIIHDPKNEVFKLSEIKFLRRWLRLAEAGQAELLIIHRSGEIINTPGFHKYLEGLWNVISYLIFISSESSFKVF